MTASPEANDRASRSHAALQPIAGFLSAASITIGAVGIAYRPFRVVPVALLLALIAAGIGGRHARLALSAVYLSIVFWLTGMIVMVVTQNPIY